jgi:tannase
MTSIIGKSYYCAASTSSSLGLGFGKPDSSTKPAQNGTVSAEGVAVAQKIVNGLYDSQGHRAYISYQMGAAFDDAATSYDSTTGEWGLVCPRIYVTKRGSSWLLLIETEHCKLWR